MKLLLTLACSSIYAISIVQGIFHTQENSAVNTSVQISQIRAVQSDTTVVEFTSVNKMPKFKGGMAGFNSELHKILVYPKKAQDAGQYGRVFITFIVELDGKISHAKVLRGIGKECNEAALNALGKMSFEGPAYLKEKPVRMRYNMGVNFGTK
ncbi:MAG: TonB family protein [Sphingobacteriales bacterium]|nr:MAG: TonB family protein [Sphingobacteriales bacterium]